MLKSECFILIVMKNAKSLLLLLVLVTVMLVSVNDVHATSSLAASFSVLNQTAGLNKVIFFNVSGDFPTNTNYSIYLNNSLAYSAEIPANSSGYNIIKYNVSDIPFGVYQPSIKFELINTRLYPNTSLHVLPESNFEFIGYSGITEVVNNTANITIHIKNTGNTPLNFSWTLPVIKGASLSLNYNQSFSLSPGDVYSIPIHMALSKNYQENITFQFNEVFLNKFIVKNYTTSLIKPDINFTIYKINSTTINKTTMLWSAKLSNSNNIPINVTFEFLLGFNNSRFYYNTSYIVYPYTNNISITLPTSKVLGVTIFYPSSSLQPVNERIFSNVPPPSVDFLGGVSGSYSYIALTIGVIVVFILIHLRINRRRT